MSMSVFSDRFEHLRQDWNLGLTMAIYTEGTPYSNIDLETLSSTFDQLITNLKCFLTTSIPTFVWDFKLEAVLTLCNNSVIDLIRVIHNTKPATNDFLQLIHTYFATTFALCVNCYFSTR